MFNSTKTILTFVLVTLFLFNGAIAQAQDSTKTVEEIQQEQWQTNQYAAFAQARRLINKAKESKSTELELNDLSALKTLPPEISKLSTLKALYFGGTQVSDLSPLKGLTVLERLLLNKTQVTDLAPLAGLTELETLFLGSTQVTDLAPLAGLTKLEWLGLESTPVTDFTPLAGLNKLTFYK